MGVSIQYTIQKQTKKFTWVGVLMPRNAQTNKSKGYQNQFTKNHTDLNIIFFKELMYKAETFSIYFVTLTKKIEIDYKCLGIHLDL